MSRLLQNSRVSDPGDCLSVSYKPRTLYSDAMQYIL
jgi:hypothetical protein